MKGDVMLYYLRDKHNQIWITVYLLKNGNGWNRGVAIRSEADPPSKKIGRLIAYQRAKHAQELEKRKKNKMDHHRIYQLLAKINGQSKFSEFPSSNILWYKSATNVRLNDFETMLVKKYKENFSFPEAARP